LEYFGCAATYGRRKTSAGGHLVNRDDAGDAVGSEDEQPITLGKIQSFRFQLSTGAPSHVRATATSGLPMTGALSGFTLDLKLGYRLLVKYPGVTVVGGLAMAFGIWFGAVTSQRLTLNAKRRIMKET
jgi:hypothetical protein